MLEKKRVNTGALLSLFGAVAALALVILLAGSVFRYIYKIQT